MDVSDRCESVYLQSIWDHEGTCPHCEERVNLYEVIGSHTQNTKDKGCWDCLEKEGWM